MKKQIKWFLILCILFQWTTVSASTNTQERTTQNLLVPDSVNVTAENIEDVLATPAVDATEKVYDFANLFTDSEEQQLYQQISQFINKHDMDLAVVTINKNPKFSQVEYADDFYDYNYFKKDGVLFLIDMDNRQIHMTTTGYAIKVYNDYRIDNALDSVYTYMSDEDYYQGTANYISIINNYATAGLPSNTDSKATSVFSAIKIGLLISIVITIIVMFILIKKNKLVRKATTAKEFLDKESVKITNLGDQFLGSSTVKHSINHDSSSSRGSSTHSSSSGTSHGGGSHGF